MEAFVNEWLGALMTYDSDHGAHLVATLSEFLYCGGSYDVAAAALTIHRSTLKYRLKRIRAISGHDIGVPDTQFNLQVATRAFRTLQALRGPYLPGPVRTTIWPWEDDAFRGLVADPEGECLSGAHYPAR